MNTLLEETTVRLATVVTLVVMLLAGAVSVVTGAVFITSKLTQLESEVAGVRLEVSGLVHDLQDIDKAARLDRWRREDMRYWCAQTELRNSEFVCGDVNAAPD